MFMYQMQRHSDIFDLTSTPKQDWTEMSCYGKLQKSLKYDIFPLEKSLCIFHTQKRAFPSESATEMMH